MNNRHSNIELLRIIAMLMIIGYHIFVHCINVQLTDPTSITELHNFWYCTPQFSKKLCLLALISPMGQIGNTVFLLISGYFMVSKKTINLGNISKKLLLQLVFAACMLGFASIALYRLAGDKPLALFDFDSFNWMSWYAGYYFLVIVIARLGLNAWLQKCDRAQYAMLTIALFASVQLSWSATLLTNLTKGLDTLVIGVFLYTLGGYIKRFDPFRAIKSWAGIAFLVLLNLFVLGNFYIRTAARILAYNPESGKLFLPDIPLYLPIQLIPILMGVTVFELFRRIELRPHSVINFIAASTFMAYVLHDNTLFRKLWSWINWVALLHNQFGQFWVSYLACTLATFMAGFVCYCLYLLLGHICTKAKPLIMKREKAQ